MLLNWIMPVLSKLTKTLSPWSIDDVSIYIKLLPIGGKDDARVWPADEVVFVDFKSFPSL